MYLLISRNMLTVGYEKSSKAHSRFRFGLIYALTPRGSDMLNKLRISCYDELLIMFFSVLWFMYKECSVNANA
jgi:hypothetical protein